jgi:hypothetical protein
MRTRSFRVLLTLLLVVLPMFLRSSGHPDAPLSATAVESIMTRLPTLEELRHITHSLEAVRRVPFDAADVLGHPDKDPAELKIEYALSAFRGLGFIFAQDLSDEIPEYHDAIDLVIKEFEALMTHTPFMHLSVLFNFFHPTEETYASGTFEDTPILSPFQAPTLNAEHLELALVLLHRTFEDLHTALFIPEANKIVDFMIQADSQNTHKLASFGFELNVLTYLVLGNITEKLNESPDESVQEVLTSARNNYGPSFMRAPYIYESLALRTTQPDASHIQTTVHSCLTIQDQDVMEDLYADDIYPLSLDGSMTWLQVLVDPEIISGNSFFTHALPTSNYEDPLSSPSSYEGTLSLIWNAFVEADPRKENINDLCKKHPNQPPQKSYPHRWCIQDYQPGTLIELFIGMLVIENFSANPTSDGMDATWENFDVALSETKRFLQDNSHEGKTYWDHLVSLSITALQSTLVQNYPGLLEGEQVYDTRENIEAKPDQKLIQILSNKYEVKSGPLNSAEWRETNADERGRIPYFTIDPEATKRNLLPMITPDGSLASSNLTWNDLSPKMGRLLSVFLSSKFMLPFLIHASPEAIVYTTADGKTKIPWDFANVTHRLAQAYAGSFVESLLSSIMITREPSTTIIPFIDHLKDEASRDESNIFRPQTLFTFMKAAQTSSYLPIPNIISEAGTHPWVRAWLSAYPCNQDPLNQPINPIPFNKTYQDVAKTLEESEKKQSEQNVLNTYVVPDTDNFVDALFSSLRLKLHAYNFNTQRLMYIPILPPMIRHNRERLWVEDNALFDYLELKNFHPDENPALSALSKFALGADGAPVSLQTKRAVFVAYREKPSDIPVIYKDLWWPKPEFALPRDISSELSQSMLTAGHQLITSDTNNIIPTESQSALTKMQHVIGDGYSLWLFDSDSIFLLGDMFRASIWKQLNDAAFIDNALPTPIETRVLQDAVLYTALHLNQAQTSSAWVAEFEDHPHIDALTPTLQGYLTGPIRSLILLFETIWTQEPESVEKRLKDYFSVTHDSPMVINNLDTVFTSGYDDFSLTEGLRVISAQFIATLLPKLAELADNSIPHIANPAFAWTRYFNNQHGKNFLKYPITLKSESLAPQLTRALSLYAPFIEIKNNKSGWEATVQKDQKILKQFAHTTRLDLNEQQEAY